MGRDHWHGVPATPGSPRQRARGRDRKEKGKRKGCVANRKCRKREARERKCSEREMRRGGMERKEKAWQHHRTGQ